MTVPVVSEKLTFVTRGALLWLMIVCRIWGRRPNELMISLKTAKALGLTCRTPCLLAPTR